MAIKAIINNTEKEIEQIKNSNEQDIDYIYSRIGDIEVEGKPPISIKSIGGDLANYRIYGQTIDGESVGDLVTSGEHAGEYKVPVTVEGKNLFLLPEKAETIERDGIIFTANENGTYTAKGTALTNTRANFKLQDTFIPPDSLASGGQGVLHLYNSAAPTNTASAVFLQQKASASQIVQKGYANLNSGNRIISNYSIDGEINMFGIYVAADATVDIIVKPAIYLNVNEYIPYEPYHAPITTSLYLPEQIKKVGTEAEYVDFAEQKQHRVRKNLWSGVVEQGNVSQDGKYGSDAKRIRSKNIPLEPGTYTISANVLIRIIYAYNDDNAIDLCANIPSGSHSRAFTVPVGANNISIGMMKKVDGVQVDVTPSDFMWGQIEKGSEATTYEPYIENTEVDVTPPALPTIAGTNVLSVNTSIQPSNMYIKDSFDYKRVFTATRVIEDKLPLGYRSIEDNDSTLKNYRIYGQTVNGESVGDLITEGEHTGEYKVPVTVSNGTDTLTTPIYLPEQIRKVGDEAEYIDYGEQKQHRVRKNLLPNTATSRTSNGVTYTVNSDGSITCAGTAVATSFFIVGTFDIRDTLVLSGCPVNGSINSYLLKIESVSGEETFSITDIGSGSPIFRTKFPVRVVIRIVSGYTCNNLTFYPMIRKADIADDTYEPYIENTDLNVTLPALPKIAGTNTLSVGTEVQPSMMMVKGRIKEVN